MFKHINVIGLILIIVSNMILVTDIWGMLNVYPSTIRNNILFQGPYIFVIVILTDIPPLISDSTFFHERTTFFQLIIYIIHWLVIIIVRSITLIYNLINKLTSSFCTNNLMVDIPCWINLILILLVLCVSPVSTFTFNIYYIVLFDISQFILGLWSVLLLANPL